MSAIQRGHLAAFETTSLISKLKTLWSAGIDANLFFETKAGQAWGTLRVCLGDHLLRHQTPPPHQHECSHDSPSQRQRREWRAAARAEAASVRSEAIDTPEEEVQIDAFVYNTTNEAATGEVTAFNAKDTKAEEAPTDVVDKTRVEETPGQDFQCELCDSTFRNTRALRTHEGRMHKANLGSPIPQFDGQQELENEFTFTCISGYAPSDILYTVEEIFPYALKSTLISSEKSGSRESADQLCTLCLKLPAEQRFAWPVLTRVQAEVIRDIKMMSNPSSF